jgi:hypothetical protein
VTDYYDRGGFSISQLRWTHLFQDKSYQVVRQTMIGDVMVSTVWLGLDHGHGDGPPIIFETMVFGPKHVFEEQYRYATEADALAEHRKIVAQLRLVERAVSGENVDRADADLDVLREGRRPKLLGEDDDP